MVLSTSSVSATDITLRSPRPRDGATVWRLARDAGTLELNSAYAYLLWCERFADSSVVAEVGDRPAGFVCGFRPPRQPDTLFVWQVAVAERCRGMGIAGLMIGAILDRDPDLRFLEATVAPSNQVSQRLFRSIARDRDTECYESPHFAADDFPGGDHDPEHLFRIGPLHPATAEGPQETDR